MIASIDYLNGSHCLTFAAKDAASLDSLPTSPYFWESVTEYLCPEISEELEFESNDTVFAVYGPRIELELVRDQLEPYLTASPELQRLVRRGTEERFEFYY